MKAQWKYFDNFNVTGLSGTKLQSARIEFEMTVDSVVVSEVDLGLLALIAYKARLNDFSESYKKVDKAFSTHFSSELNKCSVTSLVWSWLYTKWSKDNHQEGVNLHHGRLGQITSRLKQIGLADEDERQIQSILREYCDEHGVDEWKTCSFWSAVQHQKRLAAEQLVAEKNRLVKEQHERKVHQEQQEQDERKARETEWAREGALFRQQFDDLMQAGEHDQAIQFIFANWERVEWYYFNPICRETNFNYDGLKEMVAQIGNVISVLSLDSLQLLVDYICPSPDAIGSIQSRSQKYHEDDYTSMLQQKLEHLLFRSPSLFDYRALMTRFVKLSEEASDLDRLQRHYDGFIRTINLFDSYCESESQETYWDCCEVAHQTYRQFVLDAMHKLLRKH